VSTIRLARVGDAEAIAAIYAPVVQSTAISFEIDPPDALTIEHRVTETLRTYPWLVCEIAGEVAGYAYATKHRDRAAYQWSVDASVYVHPSFHRRGIGRALYTSLFRIVQSQGFVNAYAGITLPNPASVRLHESVGFRPIGVYRNVGFKADRWHDVGWWGLNLLPLAAPPAPPRPLAVVARDGAFAASLAAGEPLVHD
jgi:phosphinothricin acetyltransferase